MFDKKYLRNNREEIIEIIVLTGPINFQISILILAQKKKETEIKQPKNNYFR